MCANLFSLLAFELQLEAGEVPWQVIKIYDFYNS